MDRWMMTENVIGPIHTSLWWICIRWSQKILLILYNPYALLVKLISTFWNWRMIPKRGAFHNLLKPKSFGNKTSPWKQEIEFYHISFTPKQRIKWFRWTEVNGPWPGTLEKHSLDEDHTSYTLCAFLCFQSWKETNWHFMGSLKMK